MKVSIIGAGIAGIASSIRLAVAGHDVTIYEANSYAGGKLSQFSQDGYRFDAGPSLFTMPEYIEALFTLAGRDMSDYFAYSEMDTICHYAWNDGTRYTMPAGREAIIKSLVSEFGESESTLRTYLETSQMKYESTAPLFLEQSLHRPQTYLSRQMLTGLKAIPKLDLFDTLHDINKKTFDNPKTIQIFDRFATYNGSSPFQTPGIMSMIPHLEMGIGTYFPKGGMISITESLVALAKDLGVNTQLNAPVSKIKIENKMATGIILQSGEAVTSDLVLSNMDVFSTYHHLIPNQPRPEKILSQERSSSALIFYWGIKKQYRNLGLHNIFFADDYAAEFETIFDKKDIVDDPTVYIHISSKHNPSDAPKGCDNWFTMINTPGDFGQDWDVLISQARENILTKLSSILGENIEELIETEGILDPRLIQSKTQSHRGALYGTASNNRYAAFLRHANFSKQLKNLYFCGGSVHPGGGIPLCLQSAKIVTDIIKSDHSR